MTHELTIEREKHLLTTDHAASSHGVPVLVWSGDGRGLGPDDSCRLRVDGGTDAAIAALAAAGFEFDDCREVVA